ncbi:Protein of unknown function [Pyronema omphalodes CBS 100304]|uniref:Uncharacterized protein n=1 Tax=Pyronema omphalodes (strain CBS 100304) TaxID=1076935 RepID=U4L1Z2_PYROM|nr:Protein of unknown function [Pyronema omphalodes CBS 100304]
MSFKIFLHSTKNRDVSLLFQDP